jgi:hypothetical protein
MIRLDEIDQHNLKKDVMLIIDRIVVKAEEEFIILQMQCKRLSMKGKVSVIYKN